MVWDHVHGLAGREMRTLARSERFAVEHVNDRQVDIIPRQTDKLRSVKRKEIESAWTRLVRDRKLTRKEIEDDYSPRNPAYVAAILASMPQVDYVTKPVITLYLRKKA